MSLTGEDIPVRDENACGKDYHRRPHFSDAVVFSGTIEQNKSHPDKMAFFK
jgi:hypothetical protein